MSDADLRDQAVAFLQKTTDTFPAWVRKGRPASSNWWKALNALSQIGATPTPTPTPTPTGGNPVPPPTGGCFLGAYVDVGTMGATTDAQAWDKFEADAGKRAAVMMFGAPRFFAGGAFDPDGRLAFCASRGGIPILDVDTSQDAAGGHSQTTANYVAGKYDAAIDKAAQGCAAFGKPMLVRIDAEMNGGWYAYGAEIRASSGGAQAFVAMYQRIVTRFRAIAPNVAFHWCPNIDPDHYQPTTIEAVYPGDEYVDWAGFTGYNQGNMSVSYVVDDAYKRVTALTRKPIMIGETASVDQYGYTLPLDVRHSRVEAAHHLAERVSAGQQAVPFKMTTNPTKAQWISDLAAWLPAHQQVKAFCWFNWNIVESGIHYDWPIETSPAALTAFKALAASSYIVGR